MENLDTIQVFNEERRANGIAERTIQSYEVILKHLDEFLEKPFKAATKQDIIRFFSMIQQRDYKHGTVHAYKRRVKLFYNWLFQLDPREYPSCVKWIRVDNPRSRSTKSGGMALPVKPEEILTPEDVQRLINACTKFRDRALVALTYDTAGRSEEILKLKVGSIILDEHGGIVTLEGDTGGRRIRIVESVRHVEDWLRIHPERNDPEAPLWVSQANRNRGSGISYYTLYDLLGRLKKKAKIKKPVRAHLLRHARLTELAKYLPEQKLKVFAGWTPGSRMAGVYVHLSGKDLDEDILRIHGKLPEKEVETEPKVCPRCKFENVGNGQYCTMCGMVLEQSVALEKINEEQTITELKRLLEEERNSSSTWRHKTMVMKKELEELRKMNCATNETNRAIIETLRKHGLVVTVKRDKE